MINKNTNQENKYKLIYINKYIKYYEFRKRNFK